MITWLRWLRARPWWIVSASVGGLVVMIAIVGVVGLATNRQVSDVTNRALRYDIELEDRGDDFRVAVLDVRHYHRNLAFRGPSRRGLDEFEGAYQQLLVGVDGLERLGVTDPRMLPPAQLRAMAERYYADFRPAINLYTENGQAFTEASDIGLVRLDQLERAAEDIDQLGEQRAAAALTSIEGANRAAMVLEVAVLIGLVLVGAALAYAAVRMVDEVRRLYAEQQAPAEQLARALQAKADFLADASHELRTPLTVLRGNAEVGLALDGAGVHGEILRDILKESTRMSRLVEDLLFLARSDATSPPLEFALVSVRSLLSELAAPAEVLARQHSASFQASLRGDGRLRADTARIQQAVLILVDNAAKYSPTGEHVILTAEAQEGELRIKVADRGPGIPEADLPLIFERFYRVDKARARKQGGAGLGLAIAKTIVEAHGGRIETRSQINAGTTMTLYLPLAAAPPPIGQTLNSTLLGPDAHAESWPRERHQLEQRGRPDVAGLLRVVSDLDCFAGVNKVPLTVPPCRPPAGAPCSVRIRCPARRRTGRCRFCDWGSRPAADRATQPWKRQPGGGAAPSPIRSPPTFPRPETSPRSDLAGRRAR